ncbi:hypothetical protein CAPTEDRAFT_182968 [Capitella teleta]|uniref:Methyltransferase type 11 domain-containing protein n=1 Tax=Capitella teleta TaxID=283909 RepID=R7V488_CAPTE|nr:hypothetical protein CAPTEDRAFT_182968 [Capitella teleta]|eukprot:ELU10615.1 hypothetical protein CAPTEDRAFT_182968 [Capitella teleta]
MMMNIGRLSRPVWNAIHRGLKSPPHLLCRHLTTSPDHPMIIFDRQTKRTQRNRTARLEDPAIYDYIKEEMGFRMADRILDVKRKFNVAVDLGCGRGHTAKHVLEDSVGKLIMCDSAEDVLAQAEVSPEVPCQKIHVDEEFLPFRNDSLDLVMCSMNLHWVNDLPGAFRQILSALKNDGCLLGAIYGGDTLFELRSSLQLAETEREGGFAPHVSPFTSVQDLGNLLNRAGFTLLTIDVDEIIVRYPTIMELMKDLQGMGESSCAWARRPLLPRDTIIAAGAIYQNMYGDSEKEGIPATFQILNFIGWKPDPSQKGAAKRGSGEISLKDLGNLDELIDNANADRSRYRSRTRGAECALFRG